MTKSELDSLDSIFLAPVCLIVNQAMGTIFPEVKILWACFVSFFFFNYFYLFDNILFRIDTIIIIHCTNYDIDIFLIVMICFQFSTYKVNNKTKEF